MSSFVHLHVHTQYSLLDGAIRLKDLLDTARSYNMPAVAMTDHGNMFGTLEFYEKARKAGIKPIIGCEVYLAPGSHRDRQGKMGNGANGHEDRSYHLVLLAKDITGYHNLLKLVSIAHLEGFYYKPRIDKDLLRQYHEGLIALSSCLKGEVAGFLLRNQQEAARNAALEYAEIMGPGNFYLEMQANGIPEQTVVNEGLIRLGRELNLPLVATNDCHYLRRSDARAHEILLCIQTGKTVLDEKRMKFQTDQLYFKSPEEMAKEFAHVPEALENTVAIAEQCRVELDLGHYHFPIFPLDEGESVEDRFRKEVQDGLQKRFKQILKRRPDFSEKDREEYEARLAYEMDVIGQMGFPAYFLIVSDFINYAKNKGIPVGPGRGCVLPETKVLLEDGRETEIRNVEIGDKVITHLGRIVPVRNKMTYDCDEEITAIKVANETLFLTREHRVWAVQSENCTVDSSKTRNVVCKPTCKRYCADNPFENYHLKWVPSGQLRKDDFVVFPRTHAENQEIVFDILNFTEKRSSIRFDETSVWYEIGTNRLQTKKIPRRIPFSENMAKLLGFYIAEGWSRLSERESAVGFGFNSKETEYAQEVQCLLKDIFDLESKLVFHKIRNSLQVIGYSRIVGEFLAVLCGKGAENKHIPNEVVKHGQDDLVKILIAYMFRGDGHKSESSKTITVKYSTTSPRLASQLRLLLARFGYWTTVLKREKHPENWATEYSVKLSGKQLLNWNFDFPAFPLAQKDQKFYRNDSFYTDKRYIYLKIKDVRRLNYQGKVYDVTVAPDRSYVANSVAIHNSAAGSLVAYAMGITDLDPIEHGLIFERFLNLERISMPDIDVDFCVHGREEVFRYVAEKYGKDRVAQIATFGTMQARAVIRDVGRALAMPYNEVDRIAKLIPSALGMTLKKAFEIEPRLMELQREDPRLRELFEISFALEGLTRHASTHAAGVVIGDKPIVEYMPLFRGKDDAGQDEVVTQYSMKYVEKAGLIKFDFLGLRNLTVINNAIQMIRKNHGVDLVLEELRLDDPDTYALLSRAETTGVFQLESSGMRDILVRLKPENFADIVALVALYRPGPLESGMVENYIRGKHGQIEVTYDLEALKPILEPTYGVILYQEQVMKIASVLANYTLGEADILRRAMGKKIPEVMQAQRDRFISGTNENRIDRTKADHIFDLMAKFAGYGFNKSHSAAYALIAYQTAYLKAHYPVEFMAALLNSFLNSTDQVVKLINECREKSITILPPDVNASDKDFTVVEGKIRFGLGAVKNVGEAAIEVILSSRRDQGPFESVHDFCERIDTQKVNRRVLEQLIKCGAFDSVHPGRARVLAALDSVLERAQVRQKDRQSGQVNMFDLLRSQKKTPPPPLPEVPDWDSRTSLQFEKETLGFYISGHPLDFYANQLNTLCLTDTQSVREKKEGSTVVLCGMVHVAKEYITKKKGERMAFLTLEDREGIIDVVAFPNVYAEAEPLLKGEEPRVVIGKVQHDERGSNVVADRVLALEEARMETVESVRIRLNADRLDRDGLNRLLHLLMSHPGESKTFLHLEVQEEAEAVIALPKLQINPSQSFFEAMNEHFGEGCVEATYKNCYR